MARVHRKAAVIPYRIRKERVEVALARTLPRILSAPSGLAPGSALAVSLASRRNLISAASRWSAIFPCASTSAALTSRSIFAFSNLT